MADKQAPVPFAKPWLGEEELAAVRRPIMSGWVTQGPEVAAFETEFAAAVGAAHACAVSNCTTALHLALLAVGVKPGDEVITVSHSFIATANVVRYCGARPVFVDIQPDTFNLDPSLVESAITPRTRAILTVHQMGMPCDLGTILPLAKRHGLPVVEDAACAIGSEILWNGQWERLGKPHGDIACFSFHPRKVLTTGDGGMISTNRSEWDRQFRLLRQHGMSLSDAQRHSVRDIVFEDYPVLGYNYRMTDLQAAVGRVQLGRLTEIVRRRRQLGARYRELLEEIADVRAPVEPTWARANWQSYCVWLPDRADQKTVMRRMLDAGIATRRGVMCAHREPPYAGSATAPLPYSERATAQTILLPFYSQLTETEQDRVVAALRDALKP